MEREARGGVHVQGRREVKDLKGLERFGQQVDMERELGKVG